MTNEATGRSAEQSIEELQKRYQSLNTKRTQAETLRDEAKKRLDELKSQAREKYGTDNISDLQSQLQEMTAENGRKRAAYQAELDKIEHGLADVEQQFAQATPSPSSGGRGRE